VIQLGCSTGQALTGEPAVALAGHSAQGRFDQAEDRPLQRTDEEYLTETSIQGGGLGYFVRARDSPPESAE
jgi:hypothetical protein